MISRIFIIVISVLGASCIRWTTPVPPIPKEFANKEGCFSRELNDVIPFDESVNVLGYCYVIHCSRKYIEYVSCGVSADVHEDCLVTEANLNKPYPFCCPQVRCFEHSMPWVPSSTTISPTHYERSTERTERRY